MHALQWFYCLIFIGIFHITQTTLLVLLVTGLRTRPIFNGVKVRGIFASPSTKHLIFRVRGWQKRSSSQPCNRAHEISPL